MYDVGVTTWFRGDGAVCASWIVCITSGHAGMRSGGCISRVNTSSVGGEMYDRDAAIYRWWLVVVMSESG